MGWDVSSVAHEYYEYRSENRGQTDEDVLGHHDARALRGWTALRSRCGFCRTLLVGIAICRLLRFSEAVAD